MMWQDLSKQGCRIAIFGMNSHMWLNHFLPYALELQGNKVFYTIAVLMKSVAYMSCVKIFNILSKAKAVNIMIIMILSTF